MRPTDAHEALQTRVDTIVSDLPQRSVSTIVTTLYTRQFTVALNLTKTQSMYTVTQAKRCLRSFDHKKINCHLSVRGCETPSCACYDVMCSC